MMRRLIATLLFLAGAPQTLAQTAQPQAPAPAPAVPDSAAQWLVTDTRIASRPAAIVFPRTAGVLAAHRHLEFSHHGDGIDNAIQYRSSDGAVFGTVYVYLPGLPHSGLAAFASDQGIRSNSTTPVTGGEVSIVAAGGMDGLAIRADYAGYRGMASSAAFIKAGRWIVKLRVSGPEERRAEVHEAMEALLAGIEFGRMSPPHPATPISIRDCRPGSGQNAANPLPNPTGAELGAHGLIATFDGGGIEGTDKATGARRDLPPRVPSEFCLSARVQTRRGTIPILRAEDGESLSIDGRTVLAAIIGDNGELIEIIHAENLRRYVVLHHRVGETILLSGFDGIPSDEQIVDIVNMPEGQARSGSVPVRFRPGRGPQMFLPPEARPPETPTT